LTATHFTCKSFCKLHRTVIQGMQKNCFKFGGYHVLDIQKSLKTIVTLENRNICWVEVRWIRWLAACDAAAFYCHGRM